MLLLLATQRHAARSASRRKQAAGPGPLQMPLRVKRPLWDRLSSGFTRLSMEDTLV